MLATANSARSLNEISPLTSAYVPIMSPPASLPSYVNGDLQSKWYSSALLSMALETVSLPTRLRQHNGLGYWPSGGERSRKIFNLQFATAGGKSDALNGAKPSKDVNYEDDHNQSQKLLDDFEVDFSPFSPVASSDEHVFTQTRVTRDVRKFKDGTAEEEDDTALRRRQIESLPEVQR